MSQVIAVEISDQTYEAISADAAAAGVSASQIAATAIEHQFSNGRKQHVPEDSTNKLPPTITLNELMTFLKGLPKLGDDADDFARDVSAIRKALPAETSPWD